MGYGQILSFIDHGPCLNDGYISIIQVWDRDVEEKQEILEALEHGNITDVKRLLTKNNVNISLTQKERFQIRKTSALSIACSKGYTNIMNYLISIVADVNYRNDAGQSILHNSCESVNLEAVQIALKQPCIDVNVKDIYQQTPLIVLAKNAKPERVDLDRIASLLIQNGACVNAIDSESRTALHYAIVNCQPVLVALLIKSGCSNNSPHVDGSKTPLTALLLTRDYLNLKLMIEAGATLHRDEQFQHVLTTTQITRQDVYTSLQYELLNAAPLIRLCRTAIRNSLGGMCVEKRLDQLASADGACLPIRMIQFLKLDGL